MEILTKVVSYLMVVFLISLYIGFVKVVITSLIKDFRAGE